MRFVRYSHHNRFAVYRDTDGSYAIADAHTVTDAQLREGKRALIVVNGLTEDEANDFLKGYDE